MPLLNVSILWFSVDTNCVEFSEEVATVEMCFFVSWAPSHPGSSGAGSRKTAEVVIHTHE